MKKRILCFAACLLFVFSGCGLVDDISEKLDATSDNLSIIFAESNATELLECSEQLLLDYQNNPHALLVKLDKDSELVAQDWKGARELNKDVRDRLTALILRGSIKSIQVSEGCVEYLCDGYGLGSAEAIHKIIYVSSNQISDLYGYDKDMVFTEQDGGYYGIKPSGSSTLFYYKIADRLYYIEAVTE